VTRKIVIQDGTMHQRNRVHAPAIRDLYAGYECGRFAIYTRVMNAECSGEYEYIWVVEPFRWKDCVDLPGF
jgi:hypothetical protein